MKNIINNNKYNIPEVPKILEFKRTWLFFAFPKVFRFFKNGQKKCPKMENQKKSSKKKFL